MKICEKKFKLIFFRLSEGRKFHGKNDLGKSNQFVALERRFGQQREEKWNWITQLLTEENFSSVILSWTCLNGIRVIL